MRHSARLVISAALVLSGVALEPVASSAAGSAASPAASTAASTAGRPAAAGASSSGRAASGPQSRITAHPAVVSVRRKATFRFTSSDPTAQFRCRLMGPRISKPRLRPCASSVDSSGHRTGTITYPTIKGRYLTPSRSHFTFTVQAYRGVGGKIIATGPAHSARWRVFSVYSPIHYRPRSGPTFNRPLGSGGQQYHSIDRVVKTIRSMPGYRQASPGLCPANPALWPSRVRVSLYSMFSDGFAKAALAASRRCVSVQVLMNNHLNRKNDFAWRKLENGLHTRIKSGGTIRRSFARRCPYGCRGYGVLHTKMYLFDSNLPYAKYNRIKKTVMMGSSNITPNAAHTQWNDLYGRVNSAELYNQYEHVFNLMRRLKHNNRLLRYTTSDGVYQSTFWPQGRSRDPYLSLFSPVRCTGVDGGAGVGGRTAIYVNMHAWFGTRGMKLAKQVRSLYNRGCRVRVLYSFMSYGVYKTLHKGTGSRMSVRHTTYSHNGYNAYVYSHFKNILISGYYGSNRHAWLTWTGSNNFTNDGTHFDELLVRINSRSVYGKYRNWFSYMQGRKSGPGYILFHEPSGGGRPPKRMFGDDDSGTGADQWRPGNEFVAPNGTPSVRSDAIVRDSSGELHALD